MLSKSLLHKYQTSCAEFIIEKDSCGLFLDMGLGKTVTTLTAVEELIYDEFAINNVLVVAPKRVAETVWAEECANWEHLAKLTTCKITGRTPAHRLTALKDGLRAKKDVFIIGRDNLPWLIGLYGGKMLPFDMLVLDELSGFKSPKTTRFKTLRKVIRSFDRVVGLTGTPSPNGIPDLWSQIYLLDKGERLGKTMTEFRSKYLIPDKRSQDRIFSYKVRDSGAEKAVCAKIEDICRSMKADDYLDMPDLTYNAVRVKFSKAQQEQYETFERERVLELVDSLEEGTTEIPAVNAAALMGKLLQYSNGAIYDEDRNVHPIHDLKLDALAEIVEQAEGKPVLVAYNFKHDLGRIMERFKSINPVQLKGGDDIDKWNRGEIKMLLAHPASAGHGLNLQRGGNIIVWFGLNWSLELYQQFNGRLYRQGQQSKGVVIHHIINESTADLNVWAALQRKTRTQEAVMDAVKARINKYINNLR